MEKWAGDRDWITYVDSTSKFDRHDPSMYKDNTHPKMNIIKFLLMSY